MYAFYQLYLCRMIAAWIKREVGVSLSGMTRDVVLLRGGCMSAAAA